MRRRNPWWIPPFLGRVPEPLQDSQLKLLGAVALAMLFEEYDAAMLTSALKQIADSLLLADERLGLYLALIRLGALPALFVIPFADRIGRRPVFLASTAAMGLVTFATAFSQTALQFVLLQGLTRTFFVAGSAVALVIISEEFPAAHRGWGLGMLAALGAVGNGLGAAIYSQIDRLPYGWRSLYAIGLIPVLLIPFLSRRVSETRRFERHASDTLVVGHVGAGTFRRLIEPLAALSSQHPGRAAAVALTGFLASIATLPSFQFSGYFVQGRLGFTPAQYSMMVIGGGAIGIIGNVVAGRLGDSIGRKRVGFVLWALFPLASFGLYRGTASIAVVAWIALVFCSMGGRVILRALATELFPTAYRGAASGMFAVIETLGAVVGLLALYFYGTTNLDEIGLVIPLCAHTALPTALLLLRFPDTHQRELEAIHS